MRPPSFDEFMEREKGPEAFSLENPEPIRFETCPTPGCGSKHLHPEYDDAGQLTGFSCGHGCTFSVKRNTFTGEFAYYQLVSFDETNVEDPASLRGIKFNVLGEIFTDWY